LKQFHLAIFSLGKVDDETLQASASRLARLVRHPVEIRGSLPLPQGAKDTERGQFKAATFMASARSMAPQLGPGKLIGAEGGSDDKPPHQTDGYMFITDVDLFTTITDGVFAALNRKAGLSVVSVRRLRESFYRRKADHNLMRTRLVKEMARMYGRVRGVKECADPTCVLASSRHMADLDMKEEGYCRQCSLHIFEGTIRI
jgi:predicted Zn-dependent protease